MQNTKIKDVLHTYKIYIQIGHTLTKLFIDQTYLKGSVFDVVWAFTPYIPYLHVRVRVLHMLHTLEGLRQLPENPQNQNQV